MKVGVITEGVSEYQALPKIVDQLQERSGAEILKPLRVSTAPDAPVARVARECKHHARLLIGRGVDLIVLVLDREQQGATPAEIAAVLCKELVKQCSEGPAYRVVLKDRAFENWLIADLEALAAQPGRFTVSQAMRRKVEPGRADTVAAYELLSKAVKGGSYDKRQDAIRICSKMDVGRAADHSRSFRHLLHVLGDPEHAACCRH